MDRIIDKIYYNKMLLKLLKHLIIKLYQLIYKLFKNKLKIIKIIPKIEIFKMMKKRKI